ncbi:peptidase S8/S53 domain-containing protein [Syncephalis plumigaleata]|nr:peptidase S8/S53 domain-containing protein [Syncephalis plumigaleata]
MAGIIAGKQDSFRGVAYASELHIYNVFGNRNSTSTSLVLSALERAINSKVNVVVLPEIQQLDTHQEKLKQTIKYAATQGMIILVAATTKNLSDKKVYFSYHDSPVISVGGYAQSFQLAHWFEEEGTGKRISFISPCRQIDYNLGMALEKRAKRLNAGGIIILRNGVQQRNKMACTIPVFEVNAQHYKHIQDNRNDHLFVFAGRYGNIKDNELLRVYEKHTPNSIEWYLRPDILGPSTNVYTASIDSKKAYEFYSDINAALAYTAGVSALLLKYIKDSPTLRKHGMNVVTVKTILQNMAMPIIQPNTFIPLPLLYQGAGVLSVGKPIMKDLFIQPPFLKLKATQDTFIKRSIFIDACQIGMATPLPGSCESYADLSTGTRLLSPFDPIASLTVEFMPDEKLKLHSTGSLHVTFNIAHKIPNKLNYIIPDIL